MVLSGYCLPKPISKAPCQVPGQRKLRGVICPQSEEMAHVPASLEPGERRLEKGQWMKEQGDKEQGQEGCLGVCVGGNPREDWEAQWREGHCPVWEEGHAQRGGGPACLLEMSHTEGKAALARCCGPVIQEGRGREEEGGEP